MVVADKNELQAQKESELPGEEEIYDRYARIRCRTANGKYTYRTYMLVKQ